MLNTPKTIEKKFKSAVTDSEGIVKYDLENKPGVSNLLTIYASCTGESIEAIEERYEGRGYGEFKGGVAKAVIDLLQPNQTPYEHLLTSKEVDDIIDYGAEYASLPT